MNPVRCVKGFLGLALLLVGLAPWLADAPPASGDDATASPRQSADGNASEQRARDLRTANLERSVAALKNELSRLRQELPTLIKNGGKPQGLEGALGEMAYPLARALHDDYGSSGYEVKRPEPEKRAPPPPSLESRRRSAVKSWSSLQRPGGEIPSKPRKVEKEKIDVYFRTSGGEKTMNEVVNALKRLDEDIRFEQFDDKLTVWATKPGQEVVRQLIHYYEDELSDDK